MPCLNLFNPYITKIIHTHKTVNYIDCFAGKGKFDDGKLGSPILALNIIANCMLKNNGFPFPKINKSKKTAVKSLCKEKKRNFLIPSENCNF